MLRDLLQNLCSMLETDMGVSDKLKHSVELRTVWLRGKPGEEVFVAEIVVDRTVRIKEEFWRTTYSDSPTKEIVEEQVFRRMIRMIFARGVIGVINADSTYVKG